MSQKSKFIIHGSKLLKGEIQVNGAKNAATPILAATLLTSQPCQIDNLPLIEDVFRMLELLKSMGAEIKWLAKRRIKICTKNLNPNNLDQKIVTALRSSILLIGPMLARFKKFSINKPGGCSIGARPINTHLSALQDLGAKIIKQKPFLHIRAQNLQGKEIVMNEFSVTAVENVLMTAVLAQGKTIILCAASEPHVQDLAHFLNKMGARISGIGTHTLKITGVHKLKGAEHEIIPDYIEMGTFICLAGALKSDIIIKNFKSEFLKSELVKFKQANLNLEIGNSSIRVRSSKNLKSVNVHNMPYPGFAADLIQPFSVLMTQATGESLIHDWMYEGRFEYLKDLIKMGARIKILDLHRVLISGPSALRGQKIKTYDLRAGASLIIAALTARGKSIIHDVYQVDRGYERIEERLQKLGADIERV